MKDAGLQDDAVAAGARLRDPAGPGEPQAQAGRYTHRGAAQGTGQTTTLNIETCLHITKQLIFYNRCTERKQHYIFLLF